MARLAREDPAAARALSLARRLEPYRRKADGAGHERLGSNPHLTKPDRLLASGAPGEVVARSLGLRRIRHSA
jgi:hypothetical protein